MRAKAIQEPILPDDFPWMVCLVGSSRFRDEHIRVLGEETLKGHVVLGMGLFGHTDRLPDPKCLVCAGRGGHYDPTHCLWVPCDCAVNKLDMQGEQKRKLDVLHRYKIDVADEVIVINPPTIVCGRCKTPSRLFTELSSVTACCRSREWKRVHYVGHSTRGEIEYAVDRGKPIRYRYPLDETSQPHEVLGA